jgi:hypothetical protein
MATRPANKKQHKHITFLCQLHTYIIKILQKKISTFIIKGPTNIGRTMFLSILLAPMRPIPISKHKDRSSFHFDQVPNATSIRLEEPIIENTTAGLWKLPMEGNNMQTDMKHTDKETIHRLPIFMTPNSGIWTWCKDCKRDPAQQRYLQ